jgi:hypothetical protein
LNNSDGSIQDSDGGQPGSFAGATYTRLFSQPPVLDLLCANDIANFWTLSGEVSDPDDPVQGDVITFGGVLAGYHLTTTAAIDGSYELTVELIGVQQGFATAQTCDPHGVLSNLAMDYIMV